MEELCIAFNSLVVHQLLFKLKTAQPEVVGVFGTELAYILQKRIVAVDFFVKQPCYFLAIKLQDCLNPGRTWLHILDQVTVLFNGGITAVERTQGCSTLFPQDYAGVQIKRTLL